MTNMEETKTPYEWCVEYNIRPLDLNEWPVEYYESKERHFFEMNFVGRSEFLDLISKCTVKPNSQPRKTENYLEYRMYGLVPYNVSPVQAAIQYGHALQEYNNLLIDGSSTMQSVNFDFELLQSNLVGFNKWRKKDKTFIILDGGTTNNSDYDKHYGSLQKHRDLLHEYGILFSEFYEPDLNHALTAVVFLVDERVFNRFEYPNFEKETLPYSKTKPSEKKLKELDDRNTLNYNKWVEKIGGPKNAFLREIFKLNEFRLSKN